MTTTLGDIAAKHDMALIGLHDLEFMVPVATGTAPVAQGDLLVMPVEHGPRDGSPVGAKGAVIVAGEHDHVLFADPGTTTVEPRQPTDVDDLVVAVVETTGSAVLLHPEHGAQGLAPGKWEIRQQRESAGKRSRLVRD